MIKMNEDGWRTAYFGLLFIFVVSVVGVIYISRVHMGWSWLDTVVSLYFAGFIIGIYMLFYGWGPEGDEYVGGALGGIYNDDARLINTILMILGYPILVVAVICLIHDSYLTRSKKEVIKIVVFGAICAILIVEFFVAISHKDLVHILLFGGIMYAGIYLY